MGRKPKGDKPMTSAERKRLYRERQKARLTKKLTIPKKIKSNGEKPEVMLEPKDTVIEKPIKRLSKKETIELLQHIENAKNRHLEYYKKHPEEAPDWYRVEGVGANDM